MDNDTATNGDGLAFYSDVRLSDSATPGETLGERDQAKESMLSGGGSESTTQMSQSLDQSPAAGSGASGRFAKLTVERLLLLWVLFFIIIVLVLQLHVNVAHTWKIKPSAPAQVKAEAPTTCWSASFSAPYSTSFPTLVTVCA